ncbi:dj-1 family protein [Rutstroemia sp. NJR-2017a BBW]|nr:dj-1 family protein [Rutstroemia sp. NJR-2017a BBW]
MAPIQFGVLMVPYQTVDVAMPLDVLSICSKSLMASIESGGTPGAAGMVEKAIDIEFHHINDTMDPVELTAGFKVLPSTTIEKCPPLDLLLIGGPDAMNYHLPETFKKFIRNHVNAGKIIFATCTGALTMSESGVLDGKNATVNHVMVEAAKQINPKVKWTKETQWVVDGNVWTAGGACAGMDMVAHWVMKNYPPELVKLGFSLLDYEPRDVNGDRVFPQQHGLSA